MASIKYFDWCTIVYENLRSYVNDWQLSTVKKSEKKKTVTIPGCIIIPLAYIVDNMKLLEIEDKKCPRINQYTIETLMDSIQKARRCHGRVNFDKFECHHLLLNLKQFMHGSCQGTAEISGVAEEDAEVAIAAKTKKDAAKKPDQEELGTAGAKKPAENLEDAEVAIAAKTKKTAAKKPGQEGVSELGSGGANKDAEVAIASKTKKADAKKPDQEEPGTGGAKKPAEKKAAGKKAPKTNPAPSRRTSRLTVLKTKARFLKQSEKTACIDVVLERVKS
ncbi:uncharacterized protein LOC110437600 [Sorghum bicolor]|uniref:uncharacterized protein LOC110437600 n=1 Tax=Sorghum bicolor TaxID=4558 RepID=UPI000B423FD4|nr:uncharacterized protein LOC110437600 [Sorghum bicolor]|eukprot:XP_021321754.1 uncharacterized protein LOC110437600 [Sorghum bicolor]